MRVRPLIVTKTAAFFEMHPYAGTDPEEVERVKTLIGKERDKAETKARVKADDFFKVVMRNLVKIRDPIADKKRREDAKAELQRIKKEALEPTTTTTAAVVTIDDVAIGEPSVLSSNDDCHHNETGECDPGASFFCDWGVLFKKYCSKQYKFRSNPDQKR